MADLDKKALATDDAKSSNHSARLKLKSVEELAAIVENARRAGNTIVLCHGVFDLLHLGHVRHFETARKEGDVLIVTVTADNFVNKGPGRPIFTEDLRAEMVAAISVVDYVAINSAPTVEPVLDALKPDVYVKGSDYENSEDDVSGKIDNEIERTEKHGGRMVFTKDITFSSSSLINRYLDTYSPPVRDFLNRMQDNGGFQAFLDIFDSVADQRVLIVGETIIDEYQHVTPLGKPSKENIIATQYVETEKFAGGVIAAANHIAGICKQVDVITIVGADDDELDFVRTRLKDNVRLHHVVLPGRPTIRKSRMVDRAYMRKLFEVYYMDDRPLDGEQVAEIEGLIQEYTATADLTIVTDFGHGMIGPSTVDVLVKNSKFLALNTQTNSGNYGHNLIGKYPSADYICIDAPEARLAVSDKHSDVAGVITSKLLPLIDCNKIIVTHGANGSYVFDKATGVSQIPAFTKIVVDTVGAGDAFFVISAPFVAVGTDIERVGFIGNAAGAIKVGIVGHRKSVEKIPLLKYISTLLK